MAPQRFLAIARADRRGRVRLDDAVARADRRGRVRLDDAVAVLGWTAGTRISSIVSDGEATLRRADARPLVLGSDGRVTLPRLTWYALGVGVGQRAGIETDDEHNEVHVFSSRRLVRL